MEDPKSLDEGEWSWANGCKKCGFTEVDDLPYMDGSYKDPSEDAFSWWFATIIRNISEKMHTEMNMFQVKMVVVVLVAKITSKMGNKFFDDHTIKILLLLGLGKICMLGKKITFILGKILSRVAKIEFTFAQNGGNMNALQFYAWGKDGKDRRKIARCERQRHRYWKKDYHLPVREQAEGEILPVRRPAPHQRKLVNSSNDVKRCNDGEL